MAPTPTQSGSGAFYLLAKHRHVRISKPLVGNDGVVALTGLNRTGYRIQQAVIRRIPHFNFQAATAVRCICEIAGRFAIIQIRCNAD